MTKIFLTAAAILVGAIVPILMSKSKVLIGRWITWAVITGAFAVANVYGKTGFAVLFLAIGFLTWLEAGILQEEASALGRRKVFVVLAYRCLAAGLSALLAMQSLVTSPEFIASLVFIVALFDIGGWIGGKLLTRFNPLDKKLFAKVSPNKTWGGLVGSLVLGFAANLWVGGFSVGAYLFIVAGAVAGDWLESWVKRVIGVKDAGDWVPGFGGLLDRVDSLLPMGLVLLLIGF